MFFGDKFTKFGHLRFSPNNQHQAVVSTCWWGHTYYIHNRLYVSNWKGGEAVPGSCRQRERQGCKYSWPSCQRAVPLRWLLSLHWSLIHDIHVQWPPCLTSIMWEELPFLPPAWCQFLQETGACWSPPSFALSSYISFIFICKGVDHLQKVPPSHLIDPQRVISRSYFVL